MQRVAQDWLVLTQLTHHDGSILGIVMALQFAPQLLLIPWAGPAADKYNQRKMLMFTQAIMGALALAPRRFDSKRCRPTLARLCLCIFIWQCSRS